MTAQCDYQKKTPIAIHRHDMGVSSARGRQHSFRTLP